MKLVRKKDVLNGNGMARNINKKLAHTCHNADVRKGSKGERG